MRKAILVLVLAVAGRAHAAGPTKIGYIDLQRTLNETKIGKTAKGKLEAEKNEKQKQVNDKKEVLRKAYEEFEKQRTVLKPEAAAKREKEIQDQYVELQQVFMQLQQDLSKKEAQLTRDIFGKAAAIIENIAKRDGYTMILEKSESAVLWAEPTTDITSEVNKRLDAGEGKADTKEPAPAPAPAPAPKTEGKK
jgi:outer membrane protein